MPVKKGKEKPSVDEIKVLVTETLLTIQDNLQNLKDCQKLLRELRDILEPEKKGLLTKLKNILN